MQNTTTPKRPRFNPFPHLSCKYGAPMGRNSTNPNNFADLTPADMCASKPQGEYDSGGAYWGLNMQSYREGGEGPVFAVWCRGDGYGRGVAYVRAWNKQQAIEKALNDALQL